MLKAKLALSLKVKAGFIGNTVDLEMGTVIGMPDLVAGCCADVVFTW